MIFIIFTMISIAENTKIRIVSPDDLKKQFIGGINVTVADFGYVPYGHNIFGTLFIREDACSPIPISENVDRNSLVNKNEQLL